MRPSPSPSCVHSKRSSCAFKKRPRVYRHHAHMCFNMCAWCRYTRRRFEPSHGHVLSGHTEFSLCHTTHTTPHTTPTHTTTQDTTQNNNTTTTPHEDRERQRQRQRQRERQRKKTGTERDRERQRERERDRERRQRMMTEKVGQTRQDDTRQDKRR